MRWLRHTHEHHFHAWMYGMLLGTLMGFFLALAVWSAVFPDSGFP